MAGGKRRAIWGWAAKKFAIFLVALPVLYVLSAGPVFKLIVKSNLGFGAAIGWMLLIYRPLFFIANKFPPFRDALFWYIGLWI